MDVVHFRHWKWGPSSPEVQLPADKKKHSYTVSSYTVGNLYEHLKLGPQEPLACCHGTAHVLLSGLKRSSTRNQHIYRNYLVHRLTKKRINQNNDKASMKDIILTFSKQRVDRIIMVCCFSCNSSWSKFQVPVYTEEMGSCTYKCRHGAW